MAYRVDEIVSVLTEEINRVSAGIDAREVGRVLEVGDGIARVYGLSTATAGAQFDNAGVTASVSWAA